MQTLAIATAVTALFAAVSAHAQLTFTKSADCRETRIRNIVITPLPIFDASKPGERKRLFRLVNRLHVDTQVETIRAQLLFREGDRYDPRVLRETERALRGLRFLREPNILVVRKECAKEASWVDLEVRTRDVWTLSPTLKFGRSGGVNRTTIGLEDVNFLGLGKRIKAEFLSSRDRDSKIIAYSDPNLRFGRWTLDFQHAINSDGHASEFVLAKPFFALSATDAFGLQIGDERALVRRFELGDEFEAFERRQQLFEASRGRSNGLVDGWVSRRSWGAHDDRARFSNVRAAPLRGGLPTNRRNSYGFVQWELIEDDFATTLNKDQIGRTEDEAFGQSYVFRAGLGRHSAEREYAAQYYRLQAANGMRLSPDQSLFYDASLELRESGGSSTGAASASARYFYRFDARNTSYVGLNATNGRNLELDQLLTLGGDNGLRAYPLNYQTGSGSAVLTLEQRHFTELQPLRLFSVGAAVFADVGRVWGRDASGSERLGTLKDVGFGIRLGGLRSARANMLHIDIAWPLDDPRGSSPQFSIETRTRF